MTHSLPFGMIWLWLAHAHLAALQLSPELLRLSQIKRLMADNLTRLPNYTCLVTMERSSRRRPKGKFEHDDTVRLEVAQVGSKELFAWPGSGPLEDRDIRQIVTSGLVGTGDFAMHASSVFKTNAPTFQFSGEETLNGRRALRYFYRVSLLNSGYLVALGPRRALVAYHGSFWADAQTNELLRLAVHADDIPPNIGLAEGTTIIDYGKVRFGGNDFLLPREATLRVEQSNGYGSQNITRFTNCHQYSSASAIHFETPDGKVPSPPTIVETTLPPDLELHLQLETTIDSRKAATGDLIEALLREEVRQNGSIVAPAGALVHGRILGMQRHVGWFELDLSFFEIVQDRSMARFHGQIDVIGFRRDVRRLTRPPGRLVIQGNSFRLSKLDMVFRTK